MAERRLHGMRATVTGRVLQRNQGRLVARYNRAPADSAWFPNTGVAGGKRWIFS